MMLQVLEATERRLDFSSFAMALVKMATMIRTNWIRETTPKALYSVLRPKAIMTKVNMAATVRTT